MTMTPWGRADNAIAYGDGITLYSTPSHGGFHLDEDQRTAIPARYRLYADKWAGWPQAAGAWYEEDIAALAVIITFPDRFPHVTPEDLVTYREMLDTYCTEDQQ